MKRSFLTITVLCGVSLAFQVVADVPVFAVVGEYEDSATSNRVDASAAYYEGNSMGEGQNESLVVSFEAFNKDIRKAFRDSCGGIVNFDNGLIAGGTKTDQFKAQFCKDKYLLIKSIDHVRTDFNIPEICVPVSGPGDEPSGGFLAKSNVNGDQIQRQSNFEFTFTEEGFSGNEHVRAVGGTILGRNGCAGKAKWLMTVKLDNDDIIAEIAEIDFRAGNSTGDTFFGAKAPAGRYITAVSWLNLSNTHSGLDGFAFITNGGPPARNTAKNNRAPGDDLFFGSSTSGSSGSGSDSDGGEVTLFGRSKR